MNKHTPGPWRMGEEVCSADRLVYIPIRRPKSYVSTTTVKANAESIATTGVYGSNKDGTTSGRKYKDQFGIERHAPAIDAEECRANAHLIAAAPELLAALEATINAMVMQIKREREEFHISAEAAMAIWDEAICLGNAAIAKAKGPKS